MSENGHWESESFFSKYHWDPLERAIPAIPGGAPHRQPIKGRSDLRVRNRSVALHFHRPLKVWLEQWCAECRLLPKVPRVGCWRAVVQSEHVSAWSAHNEPQDLPLNMYSRPFSSLKSHPQSFHFLPFNLQLLLQRNKWCQKDFKVTWLDKFLQFV